MNDTLHGSESGLRVYYKFNETGQGGNILLKNSANSTLGTANGKTVSASNGFPRFANTEILPFPPPPLVPTQAVACAPGGPIQLTANTPTGFNITRFYWYNSDHPDTSRIINTIRKNYTTPSLNQTDTFFVSAVSNQMCESKKVRVVARVLPPIAPVTVSASSVSFCMPQNLTFQATALAGARYAWWRGYNGTNPLIVADSAASFTIFGQNKSDTLWVAYRPAGSSCLSEKSFVVVTRVPVPPAPVLSASLVRVCRGQKASVMVSGADSRKVRLYADSALTVFIAETNFNQALQTPPMLSNQVFWVGLSANANGCPSLGSKLVVGVDSLPTVQISLPDTVCAGRSFQANTVGKSVYHYQWLPAPVNLPLLVIQYSSDTVPNPLITFSNLGFPTLNQTFKLTSIDRNTGCRQADSIRITGGITPPLLGSTDTVVCGGQSVKLAKSISPSLTNLYDANFQYQWTTNTGVLQNPFSRITSLSFVNNSQTPLSVVSIINIRDQRTGCTIKDTVRILSNPLPVVVAGIPDTVCTGHTFQLGSSSNPVYRYKWTPKGIITPPNLVATYSSDTVSNPTVSLSSFFFAPIPVSFKVLVTNRITGCQKTDSVLILSGSNPPSLAAADTVACGSVNIQLAKKLSPPLLETQYDAVYQYQWTSTLGTFQTPGNRKSLFTLTNTGQNQLTATSHLFTRDSRTGCTSRDTVIVVSNPLPLASAGNDTSLCSGFSSPIGFAGNLTLNKYQWIPATGLSNDSLSNPVVLLPNTGASFTNQYIFQATNRTTGCRKADTIFVTSNALPPAVAGTDKVICAGNTVNLGVAGNPVQVKYRWSPTMLLLNDTLPQVSLSGSNTTQQSLDLQYILSTENRATRCKNSDTVKVRINPLPIVQAGNDTALCSGIPVSIGFAGNLQSQTFQWINGINLSSDTLPNPVYTRVIGSTKVTESKILLSTFRNTGCQKADTVFITLFPLPNPNAGQDLNICYNSSGTLGTNQMPGFQYAWSPPDSLATPNSGTSSFSYFNSDTLARQLVYVLKVTNDTTGCAETDSVRIRVKAFVRAALGEDRSFCSGDTTFSGATGFAGHTYQWLPASGVLNPTAANPLITKQNPSLTNTVDTITYYRTASLDGCSNSDSIQVVVFPRPGGFEISGSKNVCPGTLDVVYNLVSNPFNAGLNWSLSGGVFGSVSVGDTIQVNWGGTNPNARVRFLPINVFGCTGDSVVYNVQVNTLLIPEISIVSDRSLIHNDSVCKNQANRVRYKTNFTTPGSSYLWTINPPIAGTILNSRKSREIIIQWNAPGTHQLSVTQFDTTNIDTCFGSSQIYTIHILPSPDSNLTMAGDSVLCAYSTGRLYRLQGESGSVYNWRLTRPSENSASVPSVGQLLVNFGSTGSDTVQVLETNSLGCKGIWLAKPVSVKPLPNTVASANNSYPICPEKSQNRGYRVVGLPGSTYQWMLAGEYENLRGQGADSITVSWKGQNQGIKLLETSEFSCRKDTLSLALTYDASEPRIHSVSTLEDDDRKIEIRFALANDVNHPTKQVELWKDGSFLSGFNSAINQFVDGDVETDKKVYQYELRTKNLCNSILKSAIFNNIVLKALALPTERKSELSWNKYKTASSKQVRYDVLRQVDGNLKDQKAGSLVLESANVPDALNYASKETSDGFEQCYRITFTQNDSLQSYSNWSCVNFQNLLEFPNLVTANGDGRNDRFEIRNLSLYPPASLTLFDRWGKKVFSTDNYQNDWAGNPGMYYYTVVVGSMKVNGFLQVD